MGALRTAARAAGRQADVPRLPGYLGPFYPQSLYEPSLESRYADKVRPDITIAMVAAVRRVPQFVRLDYDCRTSNGYPWRYRVTFVFETGEIVALFPHISGKGRTGRQIAFYAKGAVGEMELDEVSNGLNSAFAH